MNFSLEPEGQPAQGSSADKAYPTDRFAECRASASSGQSLRTLWETIDKHEIVRAAIADDRTASNYTQAWKLLRDCNLSSLDDLLMRDIARRHQIDVISAYLREFPDALLRRELEAALAQLRAAF